MAASVLLVHGGFLGPWIWADTEAGLSSAGISGTAIDLPSVAEPRSAGFHTDVEAVRSAIRSLPPPVVICAHSYAGMPVSEAAAGLGGQVSRLVYLTAVIPDAGDTLASLPTAPPPCVTAGTGPDLTTLRLQAVSVTDGIMTMGREGAEIGLFHDCSPERREKAITLLRPMNAATGGVPVKATAWREIPAVHVRGRDDRLPESVTGAFRPAQVAEVPGGHCPQWSHPDAVAEILIAQARGDHP